MNKLISTSGTAKRTGGLVDKHTGLNDLDSPTNPPGVIPRYEYHTPVVTIELSLSKFILDITLILEWDPNLEVK